jgi:hypothetical protein
MHEVIAAPAVPAMSEYALGLVRELQAQLEKLPQVPVRL